ncbi:unnamed protein product [Amoebophrya sp. A120]|nr:unnamed protein product [Amoebophrya sp. A120]|eukprot:GSA120T00023393001.1
MDRRHMGRQTAGTAAALVRASRASTRSNVDPPVPGAFSQKCFIATIVR